MSFTESDDDLQSYLEGSVWSEKPSAAEMFSDKNVISVFPSSSHSNMLFGYPANACETVFPYTYLSVKWFLICRVAEVAMILELIQRIVKRYFEIEGNGGRGSMSPVPVAGAGEIINTSHGFTIEIDIYQFNPEEIKVVLTDDMLDISGERLEYTNDGQTLRRSFSRKYSIPEDVHLDTIRSYLTNSGVLVITGSRKGWRETSISTQRSFPKYRNGNTSSTV